MIMEPVVATLTSVLIGFLVYNIYKLKEGNKSLAALLIQESFDKAVLSEKLKDTLTIINNSNVDDKDGFIKFLSQSRDWAFEYIENAQSMMLALDSAMKTDDPEQIDKAYHELMKLLPDEDKKIEEL